MKFLVMATSFFLTAQAAKMQCTFRPYQIYLTGNVYQCGEATVSLTNSVTLESISGTHQLGKTNNDVEHVSINDQDLTFIPEGITNVFKNLKAFSIERSSLKSISAKDLQQFANIEFFGVCYSNLTSLDGDLFSFTPNLRLVDFRYNQIKHIGNNLVTNLSELTYLSLIYNECINDGAYSRAAVMKLDPQLPVLCPSLEKCSCDEKIERLREAFKKILKEVEMKLLELTSMLYAN